MWFLSAVAINLHFSFSEIWIHIKIEGLYYLLEGDIQIFRFSFLASAPGSL